MKKESAQVKLIEQIQGIDSKLEEQYASNHSYIFSFKIDVRLNFHNKFEVIFLAVFNPYQLYFSSTDKNMTRIIKMHFCGDHYYLTVIVHTLYKIIDIFDHLVLSKF